ncbi:MAG: SbcC/MukB-like Walker B domain-containing protein [Candidatus Riflebacteria bacterium]|nr:SbcC/MukB-like Walker B domain-containing protein [Candidatus Riflebacteria bacterium]
MKILKLRFKNLNSLYGEWSIDFSASEYVNDGLFALTGPTGVGKSTILDAICLALYGATPRLGSISASNNEIMSRQTAECLSEVVFQSQQGTFICKWEQRRARKRIDGNLQPAEHQIAHYTGESENKVIESKLSKVPAVVVEKTGMDFQQFTRAILLAQGNFDNFLKAGNEDKSKILEQITGTGIYTKLSVMANDRKREEGNKLALIKTEINAIEILTEEEVQKLQKDSEELKNKVEFNENKLQKLSREIEWQNDIKVLKDDLEGIANEQKQLNIELDNFKPKREQLAKATKAATVESVYFSLLMQTQKYQENVQQLQLKEAKFPEIDAEVKNLEISHNTAEAAANKAGEELENERSLIIKITPLDTEIKKSAARLEEAEREKTEVKKHINDYNEMLKRKNEELNIKRDDSEKIIAYLEEHKCDEYLVSEMTGIEEKFKSLNEKLAEIDSKNRSAQGLRDELKALTNEIETTQKDLEKAEANFKNSEAAFNTQESAIEVLLKGKTIGDLRVEKDALLHEMAHINKRKDFAEERKELSEGMPCPLCGALEHPFAKGLPKEDNETKKRIDELTALITDIEKKEKGLQELEKALTGAQRTCEDFKNKTTISANKKDSVEKSLSTLIKDVEGIKYNSLQVSENLEAKLVELGYNKGCTINNDIILQLKNRMNEFVKQSRKKTDYEKEIVQIGGEIKHYEELIKNEQKNFEEKEQKINKEKQELISHKSERMHLYQDKDPVKEEERLKLALERAKLFAKDMFKRFSDKQNEFNTLKMQITGLKENIAKQEPELKAAKSTFTEKLKKAGFSDENEFIDARLEQEDFDSLIKTEKELNDRQTSIKALESDKKLRLESELSKNLTQMSPEELKDDEIKCKSELDSFKNEISQISFKLADNNEKINKNKELALKFSAQTEEYKRWEKLYELIGSSDGKKFRNLAQEFAFEILVSHANRQMEKMSDRYLLKRNNDKNLELCVIDNYQGGEIRPTCNLSGGESFIVSLALALGLSKMASKKVRVDSLFLDEGFGSLDEKSLSWALDSLAALKQDGKLIGIISHVGEIKARIGTQINISSISAGKSKIEGPGCQRIS